MIGVHVDLQPVLVSEYSDTFELLVVEVKTNKKQIRVITGYGPQESWTQEQRLPFFSALEEEILKAHMDSKPVFVQLDANSKLGTTYIANDPKPQSPNGKVLAGIIERNALVVINGLADKCEGLITRKRTTVDSVEESIIDFVITSEELANNVKSLKIDETSEHALIKVSKNKAVTKSDHNVLITKLNIKVEKQEESDVIEVFNLNNKDAQKVFKMETSKSTKLSEVFDTDDDIEKQTKKFLKRLRKCIHKCFKKIKIKSTKTTEYDRLYSVWKRLKTQGNHEEACKVEAQLAEETGREVLDKIKEEIEGIKCDEGGRTSGHLWKLKKKLIPRIQDPPTAIKNSDGNLLTKKDEIMDENVKHFKKVLENRPIKHNLKEHKKKRDELCNKRLMQTTNNKTRDWTEEELDIVLKGLKTKKSRDPLGFSNELFKPEVIGVDLKKAILNMMNQIKRTQVFPKSLELCNISSIFKQKGSRHVMDAYRGIFRVMVFRNILERLIYNDEYETIDSNLTDSNVGARKSRNIRDNLFVLYAIQNSVIKGGQAPIDIDIYDMKKCFDSLWVEECVNDLYEAGLTNDKLNLLFLMNQNAQVAIKTQFGTTKRTDIKNIIMQGTVWGSLMCTVTMDKLAKQVYQSDNLLYKYNEEVSVPPLEMVDDILTVSKCGVTAVTMNSEVNAFTELKKLELGHSKCGRMHVGSKCNMCNKGNVHGEQMKETQKEKYLGDQINNKGTIKDTIAERTSKGYAIVAQIMALIKELPIGQKRTQIGLMLRDAWLVNGTLYNSEAWHGICKNTMKPLEAVDQHLLRQLLGAHAKTPLEFLYLETGCTPLRFIIKSRRLIYHKEVVTRPKEELISRIYESQRKAPKTGDWSELVKDDQKMLDINMSDDAIASMSILSYKKYIKNKVRNAAFKELQSMAENHKKIKDIEYSNFGKAQAYLSSKEFSNIECQVLTQLRSQTLRNIKMNFRSMYGEETMCPLCQDHPDTQEHIVECHKIQELEPIFKEGACQLNDVFGSITVQKIFIETFMKALRARDSLIVDENQHSLPGLYTGPRLARTVRTTEGREDRTDCTVLQG